jgi:hypothetical protein
MTVYDFHFTGVSPHNLMVPDRRCQLAVMKRRACIGDVRFKRENLTSKGNGG